jgi:hypothetical protein
MDELSKIRRLGNHFEQYLLPSSLFQILILLVLAFTAVFSITEIAARENILSILTGQITSLKAEFVEQNRNVSPLLPSQTTAKASPTSEVEFIDKVDHVSKQRELLLEEIKLLETLKRSLQTLTALGSDNIDFTVREIEKQFRQFNQHIDAPQKIADTKATHVQVNTVPTFFLETAAIFLVLSFDQLLAIAIMACGAIGSMITALRSDRDMTLRALSLGIASGFVVYLAIKGGKQVFLLQTQGEIAAFNPSYGSAFAGLLAGLFTERAHQILSTIVDDFAERLRAASNGKNVKG